MMTIHGASTASSTIAPQISNQRFQPELHQELTVYKGLDWGVTAVSPDILLLSEANNSENYVLCHKGRKRRKESTHCFLRKNMNRRSGLGPLVRTGILLCGPLDDVAFEDTVLSI